MTLTTERIWDEETKKWKEKRIYESFTSSDPTPKGKREAEFMASQFAATKDRSKNNTNGLTVGMAIEKYIELKKAVLSPSTVLGYESLQKHAYNMLYSKDIRKIDGTDIQVWVSDYATNHSPKTTRNAYALLMSSILMFRSDFITDTQLPQKKRPDLYVPTDEDIKKLLTHVAGKELELAILLACFGPMRRGEICALQSSDIHNNIITVNKSMVKTPSGAWEIKQPKTYSGYRDIEYPQFVIDKLSGIEGNIIKATPDIITNRFKRAVRFARLPHFRFHDLRHYSASIMHALGIPDAYIIERGGWSTDNVMKTIYRHTMDDKKKSMNNLANSHFSSMVVTDATRNATRNRKKP